MPGDDFMLFQRAQFIHDNVINTVTRGFAVRDGLLNGVGVDDLAKAADGFAALETRYADKGDEAHIGQDVFGAYKIPRKLSLHGVMTPS